MIGLCERFKVLPSALYAEDAGLLRLVKIADLARPREEVEPDEDMF